MTAIDRRYLGYTHEFSTEELDAQLNLPDADEVNLPPNEAPELAQEPQDPPLTAEQQAWLDRGRDLHKRIGSLSTRENTSRLISSGAAIVLAGDAFIGIMEPSQPLGMRLIEIGVAGLSAGVLRERGLKSTALGHLLAAHVQVQLERGDEPTLPLDSTDSVFRPSGE